MIQHSLMSICNKNLNTMKSQENRTQTYSAERFMKARTDDPTCNWDVKSLMP